MSFEHPVCDNEILPTPELQFMMYVELHTGPLHKDEVFDYKAAIWLLKEPTTFADVDEEAFDAIELESYYEIVNREEIVAQQLRRAENSDLVEPDIKAVKRQVNSLTLAKHGLDEQLRRIAMFEQGSLDRGAIIRATDDTELHPIPGEAIHSLLKRLEQLEAENRLVEKSPISPFGTANRSLL